MVKQFKELKLVDNFMFCKVMSSNPDLCKQMVEILLGKKIRAIHIIDAEKSLNITPDSKGIRMDVFLDDEAGTVYDLEMQTTNTRNLAKRSRYYQGIIDLNQLEKGGNYNKLPRSVIIFICTFDNFHLDLPIYTFESRCIQRPELKLDDEALKVFVNLSCTKLQTDDALQSLFQYFNFHEITSDFTQALEEAVKEALGNNRWEMEYMQWRAFEMDMEIDREAAIAEGREKGLAEGREKGLAEGREKGLAEGRVEGKAEGRAEGKIDMLYSLVYQNIISIEQAAEQLKISPDQFKGQFDSYVNQPNK